MVSDPNFLPMTPIFSPICLTFPNNPKMNAMSEQ